MKALTRSKIPTNFEALYLPTRIMTSKVQNAINNAYTVASLNIQQYDLFDLRLQ